MVQSPVFHWAGSSGFAEVLLLLNFSNLLLLAKQARDSCFFPKKLSEMAAAASSATLNLQGTLAFLSCNYELVYCVPFAQDVKCL